MDQFSPVATPNAHAVDAAPRVRDVAGHRVLDHRDRSEPGLQLSEYDEMINDALSLDVLPIDDSVLPGAMLNGASRLNAI